MRNGITCFGMAVTVGGAADNSGRAVAGRRPGWWGRAVLAPPPGVLPAPVRRTLLYRQATGRLPPLLRPRTFTEKLNWRITVDRRALPAPPSVQLALEEHPPTLRPR